MIAATDAEKTARIRSALTLGAALCSLTLRTDPMRGLRPPERGTGNRGWSAEGVDRPEYRVT